MTKRGPMVEPVLGAPGRFCWHDLAAADLAAALRFYDAVFGWRAAVQAANGGRFMRWRAAGEDVGSAYQLSHMHLERGGARALGGPAVACARTASLSSRASRCDTDVGGAPATKTSLSFVSSSSATPG